MVKIQRNNEWYLSLVEKIGDQTLTNQELYALIDRHDISLGIEPSAFSHHQILKRLVSTGGVEIVEDDSRKGHGREKPVVLSISDMDKVVSVFSVKKSSPKEAKEVSAPKEKKEPKKRTVVSPRKELVDRVYSVLLLAKNESGPLTLSKMAKHLGITSLANTQFKGWFTTLEKFGVQIYYKSSGLGYTFGKPENLRAAIVDLGKAGNKWFGDGRYQYKKDSGIPETAKPAVIREIIPTKSLGSLSPEEHDIIYLSAGVIRLAGILKSYDLCDLNATLNRKLRIRISKNDFIELLKTDNNFIIDQAGAYPKVRLKNGDESWNDIKKNHGPESQPKKRILARIKLSEAQIKERFGFDNITIVSRINENDNFYQILVAPTFVEYAKLRRLIAFLREEDGEGIFTETELVERLVRDDKVMNSSWDKEDLRYIIDSEGWLEEEAIRG